jgi:hypothetical protein
MKTRILLLAFALIVGFTVQWRTGVDAAGNNPSASGQGTLTVLGERRTFSFHALTKKNGTVTGSFTLQSRHSDTFIKASLNCLQVVGSNARLSGTVTHSNNPALVGLAVLFAAQDNGEGANDPPDELSLAAVGGPFNCTNFPGVIPMNPIEGGNIQVDAD